MDNNLKQDLIIINSKNSLLSYLSTLKYVSANSGISQSINVSSLNSLVCGNCAECTFIHFLMNRP